jgi:hypothetical protein
MNRCVLLDENKLKIKAKHNGVRITGRFLYVESNAFQIEITEPFAGISDGYFSEAPTIPEKYWYYRDNRITKLCLKEAKRLLTELYQVASFFERERKAIQRVLLSAIEKGNEHYAFIVTHDNKPVEGYAVYMKGNARAIPAEELAQHVDPRSPEEQRDFVILNGIQFSLFTEYNIFANRATVAHLIDKHFGIKLLHRDRLAEFISQRQESTHQTVKEV